MGTLEGPWEKVSRGLLATTAGMSKALARAAVVLRDDIRQGIISQAPGGQRFKPLAESTIRMRGMSKRSRRRAQKTIARGAATKALIHHGDLVGSITYQLVSAREAFVGLLRQAKHKDSGESMANLGAIHEYGATIADGWGRGIHITIPPRPFIGPTWDADRAKVAKVFEDALAESIKSAFGLR